MLCFVLLEYTARYAGLLLAPAEGFGLLPRLFVELFTLFVLLLGQLGPLSKNRSFYAV